MFPLSITFQLSSQLGFIQALTDLLYWRSKLDLKLSFQTQSFKPNTTKVIKTVQTAWRYYRLPYSFFTFKKRVINSVKSPSKKLQSRERNVCARQTHFSSTFPLDKITATIFQIIHIRDKTLNPCANGGLEQRRKVQTRLQGLFTFQH